MVQFDVTETTFARAYGKQPVPSEVELFAILVALMSRRDASPGERNSEELALTEANQKWVEAFIRLELSALLPQFDRTGGLEYRLELLVGLKIYVEPF